MRRALIVLALGALAMLATAPSASAHALVRSSDPASGSQSETPPETVTIVFTEEPELAFSSIQVLDGTGAPVDGGDTAPVPDDPLALRVGVDIPGEGVYTVAWRVISKVDGHATGGAFAFGVGVDPATAPLAEIPLGIDEPTPSALEMTARWFVYVGLGLLVGAVWIAVAAFPFPTLRHWRLLGVGWLASSVGLVLLAEAQRRPTGQGIGTLLGTSIGRALIWRAVAIAVAGAALLVAHRLRARARIMWGPVDRVTVLMWLAGAAAAAAIFVHASAGHAGTGEMLWFKVIGQTVHIIAVGVWLGGLAALLAGLGDTETAPDGQEGHGVERALEIRPRAIRRFSTVAGVMLLVVVLTGVARAVNELPRIAAAWESWYGRVILIKVALLVVLGLLGARNRSRHVPDAERTVMGLRRVSRAELVVAALTLVAAAALATLSPPVGLADEQRAARGPLVMEGTDFGGTTTVRLTVEPGYAGPNTFTAHVQDPRIDAPVEDAIVRLRFTFLDDPVGVSELALTEGQPGAYTASGSGMALDGRWRITVLVQRATDSAEIELVTATRCRVSPIPVPGGPTLYDVHLAGGRTAQGYVDPGTEGFNEIHITYFDEQGRELDIAGEPRFTATARGGEPVALVARRFGTGHFIGDAQLAPGPYRVDVSIEIDGERVRTCFEETIVE